MTDERQELCEMPEELRAMLEDAAPAALRRLIELAAKSQNKVIAEEAMWSLCRIEELWQNVGSSTPAKH